jgi:hypothetical protein
MINYHALLQSNLFSYNNGALYHRNGKASPQFLVSDFAKAIIYLNQQCQSAYNRKNLERGGAIFSDILEIDGKVRELGLTLQVAVEMDTLIKKGFLQPRK